MRIFCFLMLTLLLSSGGMLTTTAIGETITSLSAIADVNAPVGGFGGSASNTLSVQSNTDPNLIKLSGDIDLATGTVDGANSVGNSLVYEGDFSLAAGQAFSLAYDYNVTLVGGGSVSLTTTATTLFGGVEEVLTNTESITAAGEYNFTFADVATFADAAGAGSWEGRFEFDWTDIPANSTLSINVPGESIDFAIVDVAAAGIPEPGTLGLSMFAGLAALTRRRRN